MSFFCASFQPQNLPILILKNAVGHVKIEIIECSFYTQNFNFLSHMHLGRSHYFSNDLSLDLRCSLQSKKFFTNESVINFTKEAKQMLLWESQ